MKCTNLLEQDHKIMLTALNILEQIAVRMERGEHVNDNDVTSILRFLREFGDEYHQTKEESALFPELRRGTTSRNRELEQMLFEHEQERSLVEGLEDSLKTRKGSDFADFANRLVALLRNHIYKEDHILFEIVERSLSTQQDDSVVAEFAKFQQGFEAGEGRDLLHSLHELEWEYLKKRIA